MTRLLRIALTSLVLIAAPSAARVASAQDDPATEMARERFKEGVHFYDLKQYEKARAAFLQAYALKKHPAVLLNLAQSELRSGHEAAAAEHFSEYLRDNPDGSAGERAEAEKGLAAAKQTVSEIRILVEEPGAELLVDGQSRGITPLPGPVYVNPGSHRVEARKGDDRADATVDTVAGQSSTVTLDLGKPAPAAPSAPSEPVSPEPVELEADVTTDTAAGREGFFSWLSHKPLAWVGAGLTLAGIGGGVGFSLAAKQNYDDANAKADAILVRWHKGACDPSIQPAATAECAEYADLVEDADRHKERAVISWIVAGVAASGTIVYYLLDAGPERSSSAGRAPVRRLAIVPQAGPGFGGLSFSGRF